MGNIFYKAPVSRPSASSGFVNVCCLTSPTSALGRVRLCERLEPDIQSSLLGQWLVLVTSPPVVSVESGNSYVMRSEGVGRCKTVRSQSLTADCLIAIGND